MHLINLLSILLRFNSFTRIQKAIVDQKGSRPPVTMTYFFVQVWHWEVLWRFFSVQPLSWASPVVMWNLLFIPSHNPIKKWFVVVVQNKRRWHFKTKLFLICHQLMRHPLIELFTFLICFQCLMTAIWSKLSSFGNFSSHSKKFSFSVALGWWLATSDGCQLCSSS